MNSQHRGPNGRGVVLITGASSGVGAAVAQQIAQLIAAEHPRFSQDEVVLMGRSEESLRSVCDTLGEMAPSATTRAGNIADAEYLTAVLDEITAAGKHLSAVIHCAGLGRFGSLDTINQAELSEMIATNVWGTTVLLQRATVPMKQARCGHIVVVTSDVARRCLNGGAVYSATKHAQASLVASLRQEVRSFGIKVSEVLPGLIDTNFHARGAGAPEQSEWLKPEDVAAMITTILTAPPHVVIDEVMMHPLVQPY